jgi:hypothetical protein
MDDVFSQSRVGKPKAGVEKFKGSSESVVAEQFHFLKQ